MSESQYQYLCSEHVNLGWNARCPVCQQAKEASDAERERDELRAQLRGKPPVSQEASQTIPKLFDEIDTLRAKLAVAVEALERIKRFNPSYAYTFEQARAIATEALEQIRSGK